MAEKVTEDDSFKRQPLQNFKIVLDKKNCKSVVWQYFGTLMSEDKICCVDKVFCNLCLKKKNEEMSNILFYKANIKSFSKHVSTGNLKKHLEDHHHIEDSIKPNTLSKYFAFDETNLKKRKRIEDSESSFKRKHMLARDIALWFSRDLNPFNNVNSKGLQDFFIKYNIIKSVSDMPDRTTISRTALTDIYNAMLVTIKASIKDGPRFASITFDIWTDCYRRKSYITFTYHHIKAFEIQSFTLCTKMFPGKHTGLAIQNEIRELRENFGLDTKDLIAVTDKGSNIISAIKLAGLNNHYCLGHGLHNLIVTDGLRSCDEVQEFLEKIKKIVKALRFRAVELEEEAVGIYNEIETLYECAQMDVDNEYDVEDNLPLNIVASSSSILQEVESGKPKSITTLKTSSETRWNSTLLMLESVGKYKSAVNKVIQNTGKLHLTLSFHDYALLDNLCDFLKLFQKAVEIFSAQKSTSLNYVLVMRSEILSILSEKKDGEHSLITNLKERMLTNFEHRFPVTDLTVLAALLDPKFKRLISIDEYLQAKNTTKTDFLINQINLHKINETDLYSKNEQGKQIPSDLDEPSTASSADYLCFLAKKHSYQNKTQCTMEKECHQYLVSDVNAIDVLSYWKSNEEIFPWLATLAVRVLSIPATSTPSERVFSVAGLTVSAKRSCLSGTSINKTIFIHDNYDYCKNQTTF